MEIKKKGRKLTKYLEVTKWVTFNSLQKKERLAMGRIKEAKKRNAFRLGFEKRGSITSRITDTIIKGGWGTQSWMTPYMIVQKEPGFSR